MLKPQNMLTTKDVAQLLDYTTGYIRRLAREDKIPHMRWGSRWLFDRERIERWVDAGMPRRSEQPSLFDTEGVSEN